MFGHCAHEVSRLPRLLRVAVRLYYLDRLTVAEMGTRLGMSPTSARERLRLAHWLLRLRMGPPQPERPWSEEDEAKAVEVAATRGRDARMMACLRMAYDVYRDYLEVVALARSVRGRVRKRSKANHMAVT
jgi:hypothetical protein